jgi:hypothetical protein
MTTRPIAAARPRSVTFVGAVGFAASDAVHSLLAAAAAGRRSTPA